MFSKHVKILCSIILCYSVKGELGEFQIYFRKIPLHQQKFLVVLVLYNLPWLLRNMKSVQNVTTKVFSVGNTFSIFFYSSSASYFTLDLGAM